jgi:hypothetical protein
MGHRCPDSLYVLRGDFTLSTVEIVEGLSGCSNKDLGEGTQH